MSVLVFPTQVKPDCPKNFWKSFLDKISSTVKAKGNKAPPLKTIKGVFEKCYLSRTKPSRVCDWLNKDTCRGKKLFQSNYFATEYLLKTQGVNLEFFSLMQMVLVENNMFSFYVYHLGLSHINKEKKTFNKLIIKLPLRPCCVITVTVTRITNKLEIVAVYCEFL